jgi:polyferredoxin
MKIKEKKYRKTIQLFMAILFPTVVIGGYFYPYIGFTVVALICFFMVLAIFRGRFYCGWFCPMGSVYERVLSIFSLKKEIPLFFGTTWFRWLVFVVMMSILAISLISAGSNPAKIADAFRAMWIISGSIAIVIGAIYAPRLWCKICPMGSIQGVMSKNTYLLHISSNCSGCGICEKACPISSSPSGCRENGVLSSVDCLRCFNCIENCHKRALKFSN